MNHTHEADFYGLLTMICHRLARRAVLGAARAAIAHPLLLDTDTYKHDCEMLVGARDVLTMAIERDLPACLSGESYDRVCKYAALAQKGSQ